LPDYCFDCAPARQHPAFAQISVARRRAQIGKMKKSGENQITPSLAPTRPGAANRTHDNIEARGANPLHPPRNTSAQRPLLREERKNKSPQIETRK
jgi:hypothetical protein